MQAYNVEIFSSKFEFITSFTVSDVPYTFDYLNVEINEITIITNAAIMNGDYVHIKGRDDDFFGVVCGVSAGEEQGTVQVEYKPFISIFYTDILFDTELQGQGALETRLKAMIDSLWVNNTDLVQNITGLRVTTSSSTTGWGFNLKSDVEGKHHLICNFYRTFIVRSMEKYRVALTVTPNFTTKTIVLDIGKATDDAIYIEADLPNIVSKNITIKETEFDTNKLVIYNVQDYSSKIEYYLHTDDSYDTQNRDRIVPVIQSTVSVEPDDTHTFAQMAQSQASETFGSIEYNNLIELSVVADDALVKPKTLKYGQRAIVISNGVEYNTILTGTKIEEGLFTLIFGTVRVDLTKILQRRM